MGSWWGRKGSRARGDLDPVDERGRVSQAAIHIAWTESQTSYSYISNGRLGERGGEGIWHWKVPGIQSCWGINGVIL